MRLVVDFGEVNKEAPKKAGVKYPLLIWSLFVWGTPENARVT